MRRTVIKNFHAERTREYECDDHSILDRKGHLEATIALRQSGGEIKAQWDFKNDYVDQATGESWGSLSVTAETTITDESLPAMAEGETIQIPGTILKVLEGAFSDEVLLPASVMARAMRLPGLMLPPMKIVPDNQNPQVNSEE